MDTREENLDILRVLAVFMVVMLHVSADYVISNMENPNIYFTIGNLFDSMTRVCVPLFVMLSGTFLLANPKNEDYKTFYKKNLKKIIVPTFIWSTIYFIYSIVKEFIRVGLVGREVNYLVYIKNWINGVPFYHLWYMYMIIGLYLINPILIRLIKKMEDKNIFKLGVTLLFLGMIISFTSKLSWPLQFIEYIGYFLLGYILRKFYNLNTTKPFKYILGSMISALCIFGLTELIVRMGWFGDNKLYFYGYLTPFVSTGAICLFVAFLNMKNIKSNIGTLSKHSFNVYLIHAGILNIIDLILKEILNLTFNPIWYIPIMSIIVFFLSCIGSLIILKRKTSLH